MNKEIKRRRKCGVWVEFGIINVIWDFYARNLNQVSMQEWGKFELNFEAILTFKVFQL
jgi:hypothetical protein